MPLKRYLLFSFIIVGAMTVYGNFLSTQLPHRSEPFQYFQTYTRQNVGVWNRMFDNEAHKWRTYWKGSEKTGNECSIDISYAPTKITHGFPSGSNTAPWFGWEKFGSSKSREFYPPYKAHSVPEPPFQVLIAISLLWIPFNWNRKGDTKNKDT